MYFRLLLAVLLCSASLQAQSTLGKNLIVNGDAESGPAAADNSIATNIPGWTKTGNFSVELYDEDGFPTADDPVPPNRGNNFFTGGPDNAASSASQKIDVTAQAAQIDAGGLIYQLSGYLGGFSTQEDNAVLTITFQSASGTTLGTATLGPVTADDRIGLTALLLRSTTGPVPAGTRAIQVLLSMTRVGSGSYNDGYADNLSLILQTAPPQPQISSGGVVNAASFAGSSVSPGEIVTIFGTGLGPATLASGTVTNGRVDTSIAGVRVLFDNVPAPLIYAVSGQISAIVPYGIPASGSTQVVVEYQGIRSKATPVPIVTAVPALFTSAASGKGNAAALNQDGSINSQANPAARDSIIVLYGTGEGATTPAGLDGALALQVYPKPVLPVKVTIGGVDVAPVYAGAAPGLVAGAIQINARIPASVAPGAVPVTLQVGTATSPAGVTIFVK